MRRIIDLFLIIAMLTTFMGCAQTGVDETISEKIGYGISQFPPPAALEKPEETSSRMSMNESEKPENEAAGLSPALIQSKYISPFGNLVYCSDFVTPKDISGHMLLNWYREYINSKKAPDERKRLYTKDGVDGYIYPAKEFESYVKRYFDLSSEDMQSSATFAYTSTHDGYVIIGGGRGEEIELLLDDTALISKQDDILVIQAQLVNSVNTSKGVKELKIRTTSDGSFKYLSYITLD